MAVAELLTNIEASLTVDSETFRRQACEDGAFIKEAIADGVFDNPQANVGLEYEFYMVDRPRPAGAGPGDRDDIECALTRVPRELLEFIRFEQELGLHNAELSTSPLPLNADGLRAQEASITAQLRAANGWVRSEGMCLVSDGMWTIPPAHETAREYLTASVVHDGITLATNMSPVARYHAMANTRGDRPAAMRIDSPHVLLDADTVMPESLITSIQPHYQVPVARELPEFFQYALRIAGPLLALGVNSPVFPPDLYDDVPPERILEDAWMSHRIPVFESVLNPADDRPGKVRFPRDIESVEEAVDRIVDDDVLVPMTPDRTGRFDDEFATFRLKHGTYWRWVRPVFDGATRSAANARVEFRPIAAQPTVRDSLAFQAAFAGLMRGLPAFSHPVAELPWEVAEENFYRAARAGMQADLEWITASGVETADPGIMFADLLSHAAAGLRESGLSDEAVGRYLGPLRRRIRHGTTPARWKLRRVRRSVVDGASLQESIYAMQRSYVRRQAHTFFDAHFGEWLKEDRPPRA